MHIKVAPVNGLWTENSVCVGLGAVGARLNVPTGPEQAREDSANPNLARPKGKCAGHLRHRADAG